MDGLAAITVSLAVLAFGLSLLRRKCSATSIQQWIDGQRRRRATELQQARIRTSPDTYLALTFLAPIGLAAIGFLQSPVFAGLGLLSGFFLPRLYVAYLIRAQVRRSEREAPKLLQVLLANLTAGSTYLDALRQARRAAQDHWIHEDLDYVIQRFMLDVPLEVSIREIRTGIRSRNLALIWDNLAACCANRVPTHTARALFLELSSTIQFNVQLASEVHARASGQRIQIWLLALIVPGLYVYLRVLTPDLLNLLTETLVGRYVLLPVAAVLEVLGLFLSFRISRFHV